MTSIHAWTAVRSGATLTVRGKYADGSPAKITLVSFIGVEAGKVVATTVSPATKYELVP